SLRNRVLEERDSCWMPWLKEPCQERARRLGPPSLVRFNHAGPLQWRSRESLNRSPVPEARRLLSRMTANDTAQDSRWELLGLLNITERASMRKKHIRTG